MEGRSIPTDEPRLWGEASPSGKRKVGLPALDLRALGDDQKGRFTEQTPRRGSGADRAGLGVCRMKRTSPPSRSPSRTKQECTKTLVPIGLLDCPGKRSNQDSNYAQDTRPQVV